MRAVAEERIAIAVVLTLCGGFLDAYTWIVHDKVLANAQTANIVLFGVRAATGDWAAAWRHLPPVMAFVLGAVASLQLALRFGPATPLLSLVIEIVVLTLVLVLHVRIPDVAGTLGIAFSAAVQTTSFARIEGRPFSSVMMTGNLGRLCEALSTMVAGGSSGAEVRKATVYGAMVVTFGVGAGGGAVLTERIGPGSLAIVIVGLAGVLAACLWSRRSQPTLP